MPVSHKTFSQLHKLLGASIKDDQITIQEIPRSKLSSAQYIKSQAQGKKKVVLVTVD